jgi:hypothetical protein
MFVMIPKVTPSPRRSAKPPSNETDSQGVVTERADSLTTPAEGFLWAWNFMLTKKWRTNVTGDDFFLDRMLDDFRAFCSNEEGRLKAYWNFCLQQASMTAVSWSIS